MSTKRECSTDSAFPCQPEREGERRGEDEADVAGIAEREARGRRSAREEALDCKGAGDRRRNRQHPRDPRLEAMTSDELADDEAESHEARVASRRLEGEGLILRSESREERDAQDRSCDGLHAIEDEPAVGRHREEREAREADEPGQLRR